MKASKVFLLLVVLLLGGGLLGGTCAYSGYKSTIAMDEQVKKSWSDVDTALQRRFDLIPNIVETVKGYAKHESELFQGIADARKAYTGAATVNEKAKAASQLDGFLSRLLVIQERYPELKANENFRSLQVTLEGTENRLAEMRKRYNEAAESLNAYIRAFPGSIYAGWAKVQKAEYFKVESDEAKKAPTVKF